jgi:hypothetical protein
LLTVAQDGEVIAWDIKNKEGKPLERRKFPACTACCIAEDGVSITLALEDNSILYADLAPPMTQQIFADTTPIPPWQICWVRGRAV